MALEVCVSGTWYNFDEASCEWYTDDGVNAPEAMHAECVRAYVSAVEERTRRHDPEYGRRSLADRYAAQWSRALRKALAA